MGMKSPAQKKEIVKRSRPTDAELGKIDSNNGDAGKIISDLTAGHKSIEYEARDIALYDIRVNADNEIFRQADTQEDIVQLAEDIQRNGLMHNLVVFPQEENGKTVYDSTLLFVRPKHFRFEASQIKTAVREESDRFILTVESDKFANYVWLESPEFDFVASDNCFDLNPGEKHELVILKEDISAPVTAELFASIKVLSAYDIR